MSIRDQTPALAEESPYDGLASHDDETAHWAFGTGFAEPLAGVSVEVPPEVSADELGALCLALGDDALVMGHRLSEWCSNAPDVEDDIALANIALDLIGQARLLLTRAATAAPALAPSVDGPAPAEDRLAFFRSDHEFRNVRLAELPRGDFADAVVRVLVFASWRLALLQRLRDCTDPVVAAVATKGVAELRYHRDYAARWVVVLGRGTAESTRRTEAAVAAVLPWYDELFVDLPLLPADGLRLEVDAVLDEVLAAAGLERPVGPVRSGMGGRSGRDGVHSEALGLMLAEMQSVARAHPHGVW